VIAAGRCFFGESGLLTKTTASTPAKLRLGVDELAADCVITLAGVVHAVKYE